MREACLILKNHMNDDVETLKSKEVVSPCFLLLEIFKMVLVRLVTTHDSSVKLVNL